VTRRDDLIAELEKRQHQKLKRLAVHESSHMVSGIVLGLKPTKVQLKPRPVAVFEKIDPNDLELQKNSIISSFCGLIAVPENAGGDSHQIDRDIAKMEAQGVYYDNYYADAEALIQRKNIAETISVMAEALLERGKLNKIEIEEIILKYLKM
jgi:hypothetical protein